MSYLKNKSEFNIEAAKKLIENNLYAPSVHCSYYSCFQMLKFKMKDFFGITYEQLGSNISSSSIRGTHEYIISFYKESIREYSDRQRALTFSRNIKELKLFREKSDYEDIEITKTESDKAFKKAEVVLNFIKTYF